LFLKFNKKIKTVFIDSHSKLNFELDAKEKVNVILSPSLYWVQKISLPIKYARDAIKLLPSLFEDILPSGSYSYRAYKEGEHFFIFAYEDKMILDVLSSKGINAASISNVYFAQSELKSLESAKTINEKESIYVKDDLVILVPHTWVQSSGSLDVKDLPLSKQRVSLQQFGHIVDNKSLYKIGAIVAVIALLLLSEYIITAQKVDEVTTLKEKVFDKYKLKSTMFQNEALFKKYNLVHKKQMKLREYMAAILALKLRSGEKLTMLSLKSGVLVAEFSGISKGKDAPIKSRLKTLGMSFKSSFKSETFHLEMRL